jgi:hypothetical protein
VALPRALPKLSITKKNTIHSTTLVRVLTLDVVFSSLQFSIRFTFFNMTLLFGLLWTISIVQAIFAYKLDNTQWIDRHVLRNSSRGFPGMSPRYSDNTNKLVARSRFDGFVHIEDGKEDYEDMSEADQQDVRDAFAVARVLGIAMLRLQRDDPRYQRGFGDFTGDMYDHVMGAVRRVVNIFGDATAAELGSPRTDDDNVTDSMVIARVPFRADPNHPMGGANAWTVAQPGGRQAIGLVDEFFNPFNEMAQQLPLIADPAQLRDPRYLDRLSNTRGAIIFHELVHLVTRPNRMQPVIDAALATPGEPATFRTNDMNVIDMPMNGLLAPSGTEERLDDEAMLFGIRPDARAYSTELIGRMALLRRGRFMATLNAETYTQVALSKACTPFTLMISAYLNSSRVSQYSRNCLPRGYYSGPISTTEYQQQPSQHLYGAH